MGGSVKKIVGVAAAIAIPIAAPAIATSIGLSGAITSALGTGAVASTAGGALGGALIGAGLGGVTSELTGGDFERGALMGGIGGGISGGFQGYAARPGAGSGAGTSAGTGAGTGAGANTGTSSAAAGAQGAPQPGSVSLGGGAPPNVRPGVGPMAPPSGATTGASGGFSFAEAGRNFTEALRQVPARVAERFSDPEVIADATLKAAGSLAGQYIIGDQLSEDERALIEAQKRDLEMLRTQNQEAFREQLNTARNILGEARYFDPQYFGLSAQQDVQLREASRQREAAREAALRPGRAGLTMGEQRRSQLGATVAGQSAFLGGAERANQRRLSTYQAGLQALPQPSSFSTLGSSQNVQNMLASARQEREQAQREAGQFFGDILGVSDPNRDLREDNDERRSYIG